MEWKTTEMPSAIPEGKKEEIIEKGMAKIIKTRFWFKRKKTQNQKPPLSHVNYLNMHYNKSRFTQTSNFLHKSKLLLSRVDLPASFRAKA